MPWEKVTKHRSSLTVVAEKRRSLDTEKEWPGRRKDIQKVVT